VLLLSFAVLLISHIPVHQEKHKSFISTEENQRASSLCSDLLSTSQMIITFKPKGIWITSSFLGISYLTSGGTRHLDTFSRFATSFCNE